MSVVAVRAFGRSDWYGVEAAEERRARGDSFETRDVREKNLAGRGREMVWSAVVRLL